jgi:hypothetical protein
MCSLETLKGGEGKFHLPRGSFRNPLLWGPFMSLSKELSRYELSDESEAFRQAFS